MAAYLLTWNPARSEWQDLEEVLARLEDGATWAGHWSCARRDVAPGDRIFLMKVGKPPRGIIASGWASSEPYQAPHWDPDKAGRGIKETYVDIEFDRVLDPSTPFPHERLRRLAPTFNWTPRRSGIPIPNESAAALEAAWREWPEPGNPPGPRSQWTDEELRAAVRAYWEMRDKELGGEQYSKRRYYQDLARRFGRTEKAWEYRMQNISYVLAVRGRRWLRGLRPARHVGARVEQRIAKLIEELYHAPLPEPSPAALPSAATLRPAGNPNPTRRMAKTSAVERDPTVAQWVLRQAAGVCECCGSEAPFETATGQPFLEVHHVLPLADGGPDVPENVVAVCPNCHRALHYAADALERAAALYEQVRRLRSPRHRRQANRRPATRSRVQ